MVRKGPSKVLEELTLPHLLRYLADELPDGYLIPTDPFRRMIGMTNDTASTRFREGWPESGGTIGAECEAKRLRF